MFSAIKGKSLTFWRSRVFPLPWEGLETILNLIRYDVFSFLYIFLKRKSLHFLIRGAGLHFKHY